MWYCGVLCVLVAIFLVAHGQDGPIVDTEYGRIQGVYKTDGNGRAYEEFLGIPYATPPTGALRWTKPQPPQPWEGTRDTSQQSVHCIQFITDLYPLIGAGGEDSEDCLYINVIVPRGVAQVSELPVMVWIYGGGFNIGAQETYPGQALALHGDVIVVSMNYRVGVIGFITTADEAAPGNYGLFDITLALQWVKSNIANFGGNPNSITMFGHSAGGTAVSHLMQSPISRDLFQRGLALSGANYRNNSLSLERFEEYTVILAEYFGCNTEDSQEMIDCLREQDANDLDFSAALDLGLNWQPVVDNDFILQDAEVSWKEGIGKDHDFMIGVTDHDSAGLNVLNNPVGLPPPLWDYSLANTYTVESTREYVRGSMERYTTDPDSLADIVYQRYPGMASEDIDERSLAAAYMDTDFNFAALTNKQAEFHSGSGGKGNTYFYINEYRNSFLYGYPSWVNSSHLDDIYSVFGEPFFETYREFFLEADFNEVDRQVKEDVMSYYVNFAYTGNPNEGPMEVPALWPQYTTNARSYLAQSSNMRAERLSQTTVDNYRFWTEEWPQLLQREQGEWAAGAGSRPNKGLVEMVRRVCQELAVEDPQKVQMLVKLFGMML